MGTVTTPENPVLAATMLRLPGTRFRVVAVALGLLLLAAAGLKLYGREVSAVPLVGWFSSPLVQTAAALWEVGLGLWLIAGRARQWSWAAAVCTFSAFSAVSAYLGWRGVTSCGCFGEIPASPWHTFALDVAALAFLAATRPGLGAFRLGGHRWPRRVAAFGGTTAGVLMLLAAGGAALYGSVPAAFARLSGRPLAAPQYVDFGGGKPGSVLQNTVVIANHGGRPVRLIGGTADGSCLATSSLPLEIPPGEEREMTINLRVPQAAPGWSTRTADIWTDDGTQRLLRLRLGCRVEAE